MYKRQVHNHSLWSLINIAAGWLVPGHHAKLVTSPRGTLSSWALSRSRRSKQILWPLQRRVLSTADLLHATSETEYTEIRALGFTSPVAIIPNGIDLPPSIDTKPKSDTRILLFLSRIHPTKGIDRLLYAWKLIEALHPNWQLMIAGRGEVEYVHTVTGLVTTLDLQRVQFMGPIYGAEKFHAYGKAELFILPSHSENFGMVVAEALAHSCPAVVSRAAPWAGLETKGCGWWVSHDVKTLADTLDHAMRLPPEQLAAMGRKGRVWMEHDFSWAAIGQQMDAAYHWIVNGGERPNWVRVD